MSRIKILLLSLSLGLIVLQSCTKDKMNEVGTVYTGAPVIEFAHLTGSLNRSVAFSSTTATQGTDSVKIQLVGPQRATPTTVTFQVDPTSTAVAGTDYINLTTTTNTVVIPANQSFVWVVFRFNRPASGTKTLVLNLVGGDNVGVSQNYKTMTFTWKK